MPDPIDRLNASFEGRYRVEREIGEGGMATVYVAEDLRHERRVAVKVLRPELAAVVGAERFLAEIKTTANLQHPHILPLHDSGEADGFLFFVMPYIEGDTLRNKIDREKQLSVEEALAITRKVATALDYAHEHGVVHRDIKPGNILLSERGEPMVADFGIALAVAHAGGGRVTETGLRLGTPHYMSPEQASGERDVDRRTDVYALGCVLYEMLTGDPPYQGSTVQAVLAKILTDETPVPRKVRSTVPSNVDAAIRRALEKLPADRFSGAQDLADALADPGFRHGEEAAPSAAAGREHWSPVAITASAAALILAVALGWSLFRPLPPAPVTRFELVLPDSLEFVRSPGTNLDVSPDGSRLVFVGRSSGGGTQLWQRPLDQLDPEPIPGTSDAMQPRLSPDGTSVAFTDDTGLRTVSLAGRPPRILVSDSEIYGLNWGRGGWLYFSKTTEGIWRVSESGGEPEPVTTVKGQERAHHAPRVLPNGRGVVFAVTQQAAVRPEVAVLDLGTGERRGLFEGGLATYSPSGHILYESGGGGSLLAVPFDPERLTITGPPQTVLDGVWSGIPPQVAISDAGDLVYLSRGGGVNVGSMLAQLLVWVDRSGGEEPVDSNMEPRTFHYLELSPDDRRLAVSIGARASDDVWVMDLPDGPLTRLTAEPGRNVHPWDWSGDGDTVVYTSDVGDTWSVRAVRADGSSVGDYEVLLEGDEDVVEASFTADERGLVFVEETGDGRDLGYLDLRTGAAERILASEFDEKHVALSPDGRWLSYVSDVSGRDEVYVRPFPSVEARRWQVSRNGGDRPLWAHNGRELFYREPREGSGSTGNGGGSIMAAAYASEPTFEIVAREPLFDASPYDMIAGPQSYDVTGDDERFLMVRSQGRSEESEPSRIVFVRNFAEELRQVAPEGGM